MPKTKIIITHFGNLTSKYEHVTITQENDALMHLCNRLEELICFDARRGITTTLVYLDLDENLGREKVQNAQDVRQFKRAIDLAYHHYHPEYMVILGAQDVVPFVKLPHPIYHRVRNSRDRYVYSDLPYACEAPYSIKPADFFAPTRIVSRIPDLVGGGNNGIQILLRSLDAVLNMPSLNVTDFQNPWAVCTQMREVPMNGILQSMYRRSTPVPETCPPCTANWPVDIYSKLVYLHILHGGRYTNRLCGESPGRVIGRAVNFNAVDQNMRLGTLVLERACFGGQLYAPNSRRPTPIVNICLSSGAACVLGNTVPNYSNRTKMIAGDYIVALFFNYLQNNTVGNAFLRVRQDVARAFLKTPSDTTMLLGFNLYGDASALPMVDTATVLPILPDPGDQSAQEDSLTETDGAEDPENPEEETFQAYIPEKETEYTSDCTKLVDEISYPLSLKEDGDIPDVIKKYIASYLLVEYKVDQITDLYSADLVENGKLCTDKQQYIAYVQDPTEKNPVELQTEEEPLEAFPVETWYVFEGNAENIKCVDVFVLDE